MEPVPFRSILRHRSTPRGPSVRAGFTLIEFLVVISIVVILFSILAPSLRRTRDAAGRIQCANNLRQVGCALIGYAEDNRDRLPSSEWASGSNPRYGDTMALTAPTGGKADGLGRLLPCAGFGGHLVDPRVLYCPCHHGEHPFERYEKQISELCIEGQVFANYNYRSAIDPVAGKPINDPLNPRWILVIDGIRTRSDFNHRTGTNRLHGDGSISWRADVSNRIFESLPYDEAQMSTPALYQDLWRLIDSDGYRR